MREIERGRVQQVQVNVEEGNGKYRTIEVEGFNS